MGKQLQGIQRLAGLSYVQMRRRTGLAQQIVN